LKRFDNNLIRRVGQLVWGSVLGQAIYLAFTPIITRLYSPIDFGIFGVFSSLSAILAVAGTLRYDMAIPGCKDDDEAANVLVLALTATLCVTLTMAALLVPFGFLLLKLMGGATLKPYLWLLPLVVCGFSVNQIFIAWAVRKQKFKELTHGKVAQGLGLSIGQTGLGWIGIQPAGLIIGQFVGQLVGAMPLIPVSPLIKGNCFLAWRTKTMLVVAKKFSAFPRLSLAAALMESFFGNIPLIYVASHFGAHAAGMLTLVQRVVVAPMGLISANIGQVYYSDLAAAKPSGSQAMQAIFASHLKQTVALGLAGFTVSALIVPFAIPLIFGAVWKEAVLVYWLTLPMFLMGFVAGPFGWTLDVLYKQKDHLKRATTRALIVLGVIGLVTTLKLNWLSGLSVISLGVTAVYVSYLHMSYKAILTFDESEKPRISCNALVQPPVRLFSMQPTGKVLSGAMRIRLIPVLLLDGRKRLVKTISFKDRTYIGDPFNVIRIFNEMEVDELCLLDIDATIQQRGPDYGLVRELASECFMPLAYGGGIQSEADCEMLNSYGVEKFVIGAAGKRSGLIRSLAAHFGSQSVVGCVDVKRHGAETACYIASGKQAIGMSPVDYSLYLQEEGAGEILLQSIDRDGTRIGCDLELIEKVSQSLKVPLIALGGAGRLEDLIGALRAGASAAASGSAFCFIGRLRAVLISYPSSADIVAATTITSTSS
jgi:cyclase